MKLKDQCNIPNILTLIRFLCIPVMAKYILAGDDFRKPAFVLYAAIWSTDLLDGYIARRYHQVTDLGKLMDPFVDKVMQFTASVTLYGIGKIPFWVPLFVASKEALMLIGTAVVLRSRRQVVFARWYGKLATFTFVAGSGAIIWMETPIATRWAPWIFVPVIMLSILAMSQYAIAGIRMLTDKASPPAHTSASCGPADTDGDRQED